MVSTRVLTIAALAASVTIAVGVSTAQSPRPRRFDLERAVGIEIVNYSQLREVVEPSGEEAARAFADALGDADMWRRIISMDWPETAKTFELVTALVRVAAPTDVSLMHLNNRIVLTPVDDFDQFCDSVDYGRIVSRDESKRLIKIRIDPAELSRSKVRDRARRTGRPLTGLSSFFPTEDSSPRRGLFDERGDERATLLDAMRFEAGEAVEAQFGSERVAGRVVRGGKDDWAAVQFDDVGQFEPLLRGHRAGRKLLRVDSVTLPLPNDRLRRTAGGVATAPRTWRDRTGKFSVEATYLGLDGDAVRLQRDDGREITVPLGKTLPSGRGAPPHASIRQRQSVPNDARTEIKRGRAADGRSWRRTPSAPRAAQRVGLPAPIAGSPPGEPTPPRPRRPERTSEFR